MQTTPEEDGPEEDPAALPESPKSDCGGLVVAKEFAYDSEVVSVVRKSYVHTTESIATQTSSGMGKLVEVSLRFVVVLSESDIGLYSVFCFFSLVKGSSFPASGGVFYM